MKNLTKKGFTLIELMIVVVILGVLMSTIVPKLVGAQARGRDTGRKADIRNIETVLATYHSDYGVYPAAVGGECLADAVTGTILVGADKYVTSQIQKYFKGGKVVKDPSKGANIALCHTNNHVGDLRKGAYWYKSTVKNGVTNGGYILCADMEVPMNANTLIAGNTTAATYKSTTAPTMLSIANIAKTKTTLKSSEVSSAVGSATGESMIIKDGTHAGKSVYCVVM